MSLPAGWALTNIFGTYLNNDGTPCVGEIIFRSLQEVFVAGVEVVPAYRVVPLDATGSFSINLPSTNDPDIAPRDWAYQATFVFAGNEPDPYWFVVPYNGPPINLPFAPHAVPSNPVLSGPFGNLTNAQQMWRAHIGF